MKRARTFMWRGLFILIGVTLVAATIATGTYGLDQADRDTYQLAADLDRSADGFGFTGFSAMDYRVRISNGRTDYVMWNGECDKEPAAFDTLVATTQKIGGEYQVILPAYKDFATFVQSMASLTSLSEGGKRFYSERYSHESHVATLFHEAFHAWQFSNFESAMAEHAAQTGLDEASPGSIVADKIDSNNHALQSLERELAYLYAACKAPRREAAVSLLRQALDEEAVRRNSLDEDAVAAEMHLEMVEGTAHYVESMAYRSLTDETTWEADYLTEQELSGGSGKYYTIGMLKCQLLDTLDPGWQSGFSLPCDLSTYLEEAVS